MAFNPELSVKVSVDPRIDQTTFSRKLQGAVDVLHDKPNVELIPNSEKFGEAVKKVIGGPYPVDLNPKFTIDIKDKVNKEIKEVNTTAKEITLKVDIGSFKEDLNTQLRDSLQEVNKKLNYYLKNLTVNSAALSSVVEGLFPKKGIPNVIQNQFKAMQKELSDGLNETKRKIKPFEISELFQVKDEETTITARGLKNDFSYLKKLYSEIVNGSDLTSEEYEQKFEKFKEEIKKVEKYTRALKSNLSKEKYTNLMESDTFNSQIAIDDLDSIIKKLQELAKIKDTLTSKNLNNILDSIIDAVDPEASKTLEDLCDDAIESLNKVDERAKEIISERKTTMDTTKEMFEAMNKAMADDHSGYLDESEIKTYGAAFDKVLSEIAEKQKEINVEKEKTVNLEDKLLTKSRLNKDVLDKYKKALSSILNKDTDAEKTPKKSKKDSKSQNNTQSDLSNSNNDTATIKNFTFDVKEEDLQKTINILFKNISAPIGFIPAKDAIQNLKEKIEIGLKEVGVNATLTGGGASEGEEKTDKKIPLQGKVELNEEDVTPPKSPVKIPGHVTLTKTDVTVPEEPVDILAKANIIDSGENKPSTEATATVKTENVTVVGDAVTVPTKSVLETKDVVPPINPVDIKGKVTLEVGDIKVPDKIDLNGNLVIKNATKEIRDATKKANGTNKAKSNASNRDFDRKSKELLTSLASLTKGLAKTENSMKKHANGINPEAYDEDSLYSARIQRRIRTTKTKLTKLYKGHGGRKAWENDSIYTSAVEDAEHISHGYDASLKDDQLKQETKEFAAAEQSYLSALRERPKLYKEISDAQKKYGDDSEYVKSAQKKLVGTISTIKEFESSVGSDYLSQMPERKKIFEENMSNLRKQRDDVVRQNTQIADKQQIADNKERIKSENEFLDALAKEPELWKRIEEARKKFGDNSPEVTRAKNEQSKNNDIIQKFKSGYNGSLSDIDGYDEQIRENNLNYGVYSAEIARKAQEEAQTRHDTNQKAFAKARENKTKQQTNSTKAAKAQQDQWLKDAEDVINEAKKKYIAAFKEVQELQKKLLQTNDQQLQTDLNQRISEQRKAMKNNGDILNGYTLTPLTNELAQNAFSEIQALRTSTRNEARDNAALQNERDIINDIVSSCKELQGLYKNRQQLFKPEDATELTNVDQRIQNIEQHVQDLIDTSENAGISILNSSDVNDALNNYSNAAGKSNAKFSNSKLKYTIDTAKGSYIENFKKKRENEDYLSRIDQNDPKAVQMEKQYKQWIQENEAAIQQAAQVLNSCHAAANDAWKEIQEVVNSSNIKDTEAANKAADAAVKKNKADAKKAASDAKKQETEDTQFFNQLNQAVNAKLRTYKAFLEAERKDPTKKSKNYLAAKGNFDDADVNFAVAVQNAINSGLNTDSRFDNVMNRHNRNMNAIGEASDKRAQAETEAIKVTEKDISVIRKLEDQLDGIKDRIRNAGGTDSDTYNNVVGSQSKIQELRSRLEAELQKPGSDKNVIAVQWASENNINNVKSLDEVVRRLTSDISHLNTEGGKISADKSLRTSTTKAKTELANLKSQLHDYLQKFPAIESEMADDIMKLQQALADPNAYNNIGGLKQAFAELRSSAKELGLETESLIDKFKNLFGQHLSTMITMASLHDIQDSLQIVYQNVVEIDTAMTELRKISNMTASEMEKYMDRAAESAQKLGVSISDFISSTADWKRLGYSDEDAENLATYSTLLKNVGDGIDDVSTSSSYLISTLQGFGLLAEDAEDVVNKIDAVANTQPVTANDIGEILTRSSASMKAANNTLEQTIALGTAANAVIQDADTVGTTLKSLSMYLRAAKTDAEEAGIEVDGMANSVSELRSELKSLTGVDIMLDSKNFKSTYQIMKELSEVWGSLSDVTQANVTEMIGGKRNANAVSAILNNFSVAESAMESAANSANVAWAENEKYLDSIQGRLNQLEASFQALSQDTLDDGLVKSVVSLATALVKGADSMIKFTGAFPAATFIGTFVTQLGEPKMTGFMIVPSNTPGGDTEQMLRNRRAA